MVYSFQRNLGMGEFTDPSDRKYDASNLPWESIEATDEYTVVMKMTEPSLDALRAILQDVSMFILPREVIDEYGDYEIGGTWSAPGPLS